jgi:hypothetical protein
MAANLLSSSLSWKAVMIGSLLLRAIKEGLAKALKKVVHIQIAPPYDNKIVVIGLSGILKGKQKLGVTFNSDKLGGIDFTKVSKLTMCSA